MDLLITGQLLLPDPTAGVRLAPGTVTVRSDRIASVADGLHPRPDFGGPDFLISPGFVDTHVHLPQFDSIGIDGLELLDWLATAIFPAEAKWADAEYAGAMSGRVARELLSFGTTSVGAYATVHHEGARAAIIALAQAGLSGHVGQVLMDRNAPADLLLPAKRSLASCAALTPQARIAPAVTPRFAVACTEELLRGAGELAATTGWLIQTHLAETRREVDLVRQLFPGDTYTGVYEKTGLLTPRTILAHAIHLDQADLARIHKAGSTIAHCPTANRFLKSGDMNSERVVGAGVNLALGSDVAGGPDRSMIRVARAMIETAKQLNTTPPTAAACWTQITATNAQVLGLTGTGSLKVGNWADILVVHPLTKWLETPDPLSHLLYAWDDRWLKVTITAGEPRWQGNP